MEYLRRTIREFTHHFLKMPNQETVFEVSRLDAYFNTIYKIILWKDPILSWTIFGVFHVLFWIIIHFQLRLYGIVFISILIGILTDLYFERIGLQASRNENSDAIRDVFNIFIHIFLYLKVLRKDNPSMFCGLMCTVFIVISMLSKNIPGYFLAYLILISIFFGPLVISKLPNEYKSNIVSTVRSLSSNEGILAETELIPFIANKEMNEKDPELESLLTDKTADSITSSLINGINSMPSYLEAEGSLDGLDEEDLVPNMKSSGSANTPDDNSSDSDSEHKNMKFESAHFNGDSSSDDEKHYTAGLRFSEVHEVVDAPVQLNVQEKMAQSLALGLLSNLTAVGTSIMTNVMSSTKTDKPKRKDSDSDFEFINPEDADEQT